MSNFAEALPVTVAELADHEERALIGDQPPDAVEDVNGARQLVVPAQVQGATSTPGSKRRRRRKRSVGQPSTSLPLKITRIKCTLLNNIAR